MIHIFQRKMVKPKQIFRAGIFLFFLLSSYSRKHKKLTNNSISLYELF